MNLNDRPLSSGSIRDLFGLKRAPEFDDWLLRTGLADTNFRLAGDAGLLPEFASRLIA